MRVWASVLIRLHAPGVTRDVFTHTLSTLGAGILVLAVHEHVRGRFAWPVGVREPKRRGKFWAPKDRSKERRIPRYYYILVVRKWANLVLRALLVKRMWGCGATSMI